MLGKRGRDRRFFVTFQPDISKISEVLGGKPNLIDREGLPFPCRGRK